MRFLRLFHNKDEAKFEPPEKGKSELREDFWYEGWKPEEGREARPEEIMTDDEVEHNCSKSIISIFYKNVEKSLGNPKKADESSTVESRAIRRPQHR